MKFRLFGCTKFSRLLSDAQDRLITDSERRYMDRHRTVCPNCRKKERESDLALNMLRMAAFDVDPEPQFDQRVLRRHKLDTVREDIRYWSPTVWGAAFAVVAIFAALQMVSRSAQLPVFHGPGTDAKRVTSEAPLIPDWNPGVDAHPFSK
ncbi:MAG: hypothetical protein KF784_01200 [Fimbriimonadaceae bacterium]|nr:hypothetical protein [Fimbriimonadaceae bacterium]